MIQELLGGASLIGGERKISLTSVLDSSPSPSPSPSSSSSTTTITPTTTITASSETQNLRCPRCDSSNTKFCYYNNYNLTQPRHFCKTCRRYWTKGGALRNVPIGGGCRKNKTSNITSTITSSSSLITKSSSAAGRLLKSNLSSCHEIENSNPIMWAPVPQHSHLLALLRSNQNPTPNLDMNPNVKEENVMIGHDPFYQITPLWRSNLQQAQQPNGFVLGGQDMYQRLRSSATNYCNPDQTPVFLNNVSSPSSTILESAPGGGGGEFGYWNHPRLSWSDLPTTNGAYHL